MEIKRMRGKYVRIVPKFITHEVNEYIDLPDGVPYRDDSGQSLMRTDETDEEWKEKGRLYGSEPYIEEEVYLEFGYLKDPYQIFIVRDELFGIDLSMVDEINIEKASHQIILSNTQREYISTSALWDSKYFEVVKKVEEITTKHLPNGVTKEIKTISWVRDEEFYK